MGLDPFGHRYAAESKAFARTRGVYTALRADIQLRTGIIYQQKHTVVCLVSATLFCWWPPTRESTNQVLI
jgi:hypothetical protein